MIKHIVGISSIVLCFAVAAKAQEFYAHVDLESGTPTFQCGGCHSGTPEWEDYTSPDQGNYLGVNLTGGMSVDLGGNFFSSLEGSIMVPISGEFLGEGNGTSIDYATRARVILGYQLDKADIYAAVGASLWKGPALTMFNDYESGSDTASGFNAAIGMNVDITESSKLQLEVFLEEITGVPYYSDVDEFLGPMRMQITGVRLGTEINF